MRARTTNRNDNDDADPIMADDKRSASLSESTSSPRITLKDLDKAGDDRPFFQVPGMHAGFLSQFAKKNGYFIETFSFRRVWGDSGERHAITVDGVEHLSEEEP
jgi:hypothetical protein